MSARETGRQSLEDWTLIMKSRVQTEILQTVNDKSFIREETFHLHKNIDMCNKNEIIIETDIVHTFNTAGLLIRHGSFLKTKNSS